MKKELYESNIPSILASDLYPRGVPGETVTRVWSFGGGVRITVEFAPVKWRVECVVTHTIARREPRSVSYEVDVSWTPLNFGGGRVWLHCSRCGKRGPKLYLDGTQLVCRVCAGIKYASKNQRSGVRARAKADQIRARLGGPPGPSQTLPAKPKGMHWSTYDRLCAEVRELEAYARDDAISRLTSSGIMKRGPLLSSARASSGYESPLDALRLLLEEREARRKPLDDDPTARSAGPDIARHGPLQSPAPPSRGLVSEALRLVLEEREARRKAGED